jgi:4-hydroxybenzoate polyprenyltransferase
MTEASNPTHIADARPQNWIERFAPSALLPYAQLARLDRPIGWWLLLLPCWWSLVLAQISVGGGLPKLWYAFLLLLGAIVMRGAGCTLNDLADADFDAKVERTRERPIPSGRVSKSQALVFLALQLIIGLIVLLQFNWFTIKLAAASLIIVAIYPFMKRFTYWPQFVLGLAFNWGALVGWSAATGGLAWPPVLLYAAGIFWTLAYDTIYAHQDKDDDILIGVKSTALLFGAKTLPWLAGFFATSLALVASGIIFAGGHLLALMGVACAAMHAAWQLARFDHTNSALCLKLMHSNRIYGLIILLWLVLDSILT